MIDNGFRSFLPNYVRPLLKLYQMLGLSPNAVTIAGCLGGLASAFAVSQGMFIVGLCLWWMGRLLDGTDGIYARHLNQSSKFGAFLDINCDMLAYSAMIVAFAKMWPELSLIWILIMLLYVLSISGALSLGSLEAESTHSSNRKLKLATGIAEGGETGFFYSCCLIFPASISILSQIWIGVLLVSIVARGIMAFKYLKEQRLS